MPEMVELIGRRFRVLRRAEKTCFEITPGRYAIREFRKNDVFLLEGLRCSGTAHDGCQRQCTLLWKAAWLRRVEGDGPAPHVEQADVDVLRAKLKTRSGPVRYVCQSTELVRATEPQPITRKKILLKCLRDVRSGAVGPGKMVSLVVAPLYRKVRDRVRGRPRLVGELTRTPLGTIGLQPGEMVR